MEHELKTWIPYFNAVASGLKTFEVRQNDRDFQLGDILHLLEYDNFASTLTGRRLTRIVTSTFDGTVLGRDYRTHRPDDEAVRALGGVSKGFIVLGLGDPAQAEELRLLREIRREVGSWPWGMNGESIEREAIDFRPIADLLAALDRHREGR